MVSTTSEDAPAPACGPHMLLPVGKKQAAAWLPGCMLYWMQGSCRSHLNAVIQLA